MSLIAQMKKKVMLRVRIIFLTEKNIILQEKSVFLLWIIYILTNKDFCVRPC